jgi:phosphate-selective porin
MIRRALVGAAGAAAVSAGRLAAQTEDLPPPRPGYTSFVPDLPDTLLAKTAVRTRWFTLKWGAAPIVDYSSFSQDSASLEQVGRQEAAWQIRSGRIQARGTLFNTATHPWRYLLSFEYKGLDTDPDVTWNFTDISLTIPAGALGELTLGKIKEPFVYEMVGDAANLPHVERLLSPFFVSRNWGLRLSHTAFDQRMTWAAGIFNDWFTADLPLTESGTSVTARVTGLPVFAREGRRFLHLGAAYRYVGSDQDSLRLRGRPESNVTDYYVDTRKFAAAGMQELGLELLANEGPWSLTGEYARAWTDAPAVRDPGFWGWYLTGAWVVTGEHRPYDRKAGYARRVLPGGHWGALELVGRYGKVDLDDAGVAGGTMTKWYAGANWWANRRWRLSLGYGNATLDRFDLTGETRQFFSRLQWVF